MTFTFIWQEIIAVCKSHPEILIFLAIAIGYYVGKIKFFGFSLGSTASVLLSALVLGQLDVTITPLIRMIAFSLFIFTIGYKVGPQFFGSLKKEGIHYLVLAIFFALVGLAAAIILGKLFGFDQGTTAGLMGGALTQSSIIGTAEGAIQGLSISAAQKSLLSSNIAIAYAITYIFGVAGLILFYKLIPKLLRINLKDNARKVEEQLSGGPIKEDDDTFTWNEQPSMRVFRVTNTKLDGKTIRDLQKLLTKKVTIIKIKHGKKLIDPEPGLVLQVRDKIAIIAKRAMMFEAAKIIGPEVNDYILSTIPHEALKIYVTKPKAVGKKISKVIASYGNNCFVEKLIRNEHEFTFTKNARLQKYDVLHVIGIEKDVEAFAKTIGHAERETKVTDMVMVGIGCFLGTLLGLAAVKIGTIPITLGVGGGVLVSGLFFGWLRSVNPTFGYIPEGTQWLLTNFGLNLFIACVGLTAGPRALHALQTNGISLFLAGLLLTLIPHILGLIFGKIILKMDYVLLLGALTGAGTATPALNVLKNEADSPVPALGYTIPYALGNFILTVWGTVIIYVMT